MGSNKMLITDQMKTVLLCNFLVKVSQNDSRMQVIAVGNGQ